MTGKKKKQRERDWKKDLTISQERNGVSVEKGKRGKRGGKENEKQKKTCRDEKK